MTSFSLFFILCFKLTIFHHQNHRNLDASFLMPHLQLPLHSHLLLNTFIKSKNFVCTMEEKKKDRNNVLLKEHFHGLFKKESKEENHRISSTRLENLRECRFAPRLVDNRSQSWKWEVLCSIGEPKKVNELVQIDINLIYLFFSIPFHLWFLLIDLNHKEINPSAE